jgi:hypothetical protein
MTEKLRTENGFANPDDLYDALIEAHRDLSEEQSATLNASLILILANHIADIDVVKEALRLAREGAFRR